MKKKEKLNPVIIILIILAALFVFTNGEFSLMSIVGADVTRAFPSEINPSSQFPIIYTISDSLDNNTIDSITDSVSGGCTFLEGTTLNNVSTFKFNVTERNTATLLLAPASGTCVFEGVYTSGTSTITLTTSRITVTVPAVVTNNTNNTNQTTCCGYQFINVTNTCKKIETCYTCPTDELTLTECNALIVTPNTTTETCAFYENYNSDSNSCELSSIWIIVGVVIGAGIIYYTTRKRGKKK
jgi:hypothetical protein